VAPTAAASGRIPLTAESSRTWWSPPPTAAPQRPRRRQRRHLQGHHREPGPAAQTPANVVHGVIFSVDARVSAHRPAARRRWASAPDRILTASTTWKATAGTHTLLVRVDDVNRIADRTRPTTPARARSRSPRRSAGAASPKPSRNITHLVMRESGGLLRLFNGR
jgi:hypothetical protein